MSTKPSTAKGYPPAAVELVRATCLHAATRLGDLMDEVVIVGGLVPSLLLVPGSDPDDPLSKHVGTLDLDFGLELSLRDSGRYKTFSERLRNAGFRPDKSEKGEDTRQRWEIREGERSCTVDFLIPRQGDGKLMQDLEKDFAALRTRGLHLAFQDHEKVMLSGETLRGELCERQVNVCGPGAFVVLKTFAMRNRAEPKDAYDLFLMLRNYGSGPADVAARLRPFVQGNDVAEAVEFLAADFATIGHLGPRLVQQFLSTEDDEALRQDVVGHVESFIQEMRTDLKQQE